MLSHRQIWEAIDALAARHGLSTSALARRAGLDPTAFNRSKRVSGDGRARWPSTESIARILEATGETVADFFTPGDGRAPPGPHVQLIGFAEAGTGGFFDDAGFPVGGGWEKVAYPGPGTEHAYALAISGDSMEPVYRDGDIVVVAPDLPVRRGDRVVAKTTEGEVMAKVLGRRSGGTVELLSLNPAHEDRILHAVDVEWIARIVWASQ